MVKTSEDNMDDLGVPPFQETFIFIYIHIHIYIYTYTYIYIYTYIYTYVMGVSEIALYRKPMKHPMFT